MSINRRQALKALTTTALATSFSRAVQAKPKALKVLILGGTGFIGPHFTQALLEHGHAVTLFNRGKRDPAAKPGVEQLLGDRNGQVEALKGREFDVVIDNSGYLPRQVKLTAELLRPHSAQYIFISSISVYADFAAQLIDENYKLATLKDPTVDVVNGETYGGLKVLCEKVALETYGKQATIIRPTYIAGPGDHTDRFTYWPFRVAQGGEMLAPGTPADTISYIDVRDLAEFVRRCAEKHISGTFNLCSPAGGVTMGRLLDTSKRVTKADTKFTWASTEFLTAQGLTDDNATPPNQIPIWAPPTGDSQGTGLVSSKRAVAKGLKFRPMEKTIRETLEWQKTRPPEKQILRAGLKPEREAELLRLLKNAN